MPTPERTSNPAIVAAGRALLDEGGPSRVTMQAVADAVGVRAPSLYKRVRDRDALLSAITEDAVGELAGRLEKTGGDLESLLREFRAFAHERPHAFGLVFAHGAPVAVLERSVRPLLDATTALVTAEHALDAARYVTAWAVGFAQMELWGAFHLGGDVDDAFEFGLARLVASLESA